MTPVEIFLRFLRFGVNAWGGPTAQIAMLKHELVEREGWIEMSRFRRVLSVYQALPGPEAHEMCVYFGFLKGGRLGGIMAGLGFMLPGFLLMLAASALYVQYGLTQPLVLAAFAGIQPIVWALILRGGYRIGKGILNNRWLWGAAIGAAILILAGFPFYVGLAFAGVLGSVHKRGKIAALWVSLAGAFGAAAWKVYSTGMTALVEPVAAGNGPAPSLQDLFATGLKGGLLTFGGAYTAIPFVRHDTVIVGGWISEGQFIDGFAISSVLPAPLVIFVTHVGFIGAGLPGALAITAGMFLPAFAFTLIGHDFFEKVVDYEPAHGLLDGMAAGAVGIIAVTAVQMGAGFQQHVLVFVMALLALAFLSKVQTGWATPAAILAGAVAGMVLPPGLIR